MKRKLILIIISMLFVVSSFSSISFAYKNDDKPQTILNDSSNAEILLINYYDKVDILKNGDAKLDFSIEIPQSILLEKYHNMLGLYEKDIENTKPIELPQDRVVKRTGTSTQISTDKEEYYKTLSKEHILFLGMDIKITDSYMIPLTDDGAFFLNAKGTALLNIVDLNDDKWTISIHPECELGADSYAGLFISSRQSMLNSYPNEQIFKRIWTTELNIPEGATLFNYNELSNLNWKHDFGGGTYLEASVVTVSESKIIIKETLVITENEIGLTKSMKDYKNFELEYTLPDSPSNIDNSYILATTASSGSSIFEYDETFEVIDWSDTITIASNENLEVNCSFLMQLDCRVFIKVDWGVAEVWAKPHLYAQADFNAHAEYSYTYGDNEWTDILSKPWDYTISVGTHLIYVEVEPQYKIDFVAGGSVDVSASAWVDATLKAGATFSLDDGFNVIWDPQFDYDYTDPIYDEEFWDANVFVHIRPAIGAEISARLDYIIGPLVRPSLYVQGDFTYDIDDQLFSWGIIVGLDLTVGIEIGIPYLWETSWEWTIADYPIFRWGSSDFFDYDPPDTKAIGFPVIPDESNGWNYVGHDLYLWFESEDKGDIPSGVDYVNYGIGTTNPNQVYEYEYDSDLPILHASITGNHNDQGKISFCGVDHAGNQENTKVAILKSDFQAPSTNLVINGDYFIDEDGNFHVQENTKFKITGSDDHRYKIWYTNFDDDGDWDSEWKTGDWDESVRNLYFPESGTYTFEYFAQDYLWNFEDTNRVTFIVHDLNEPITVNIDEPDNCLYIYGNKISAIELDKPTSLGPFHIDASASSDSRISYIDFDIDGMIRETIYSDEPHPEYFSGSWTWDDKIGFFDDRTHTIGICAENMFQGTNYVEKEVTMLNPSGTDSPPMSFDGEHDGYTINGGEIWSFTASTDLDDDLIQEFKNIQDAADNNDEFEVDISFYYDFDFGDGNSVIEDKNIAEDNPKSQYIQHVYDNGKKDATVTIKAIMTINGDIDGDGIEDEEIITIFENTSVCSKEKAHSKESNYKPLLPLLRQRIIKIFEMLKLDETLKNFLMMLS